MVTLDMPNSTRRTANSVGSPGRGEPVVFGTNIKHEPFTLMTLTDDQLFAIGRAKQYALEQSIQSVINKQAAQMHQQDLNAVKRNQALILLSRIYVGSISFEIGEEEIRKTFSPFGPIKSVALSWDTVLQKHKGFAFVEFEVPEAASLALEQMNGFTLAGRNLKVGRPSNAPQISSLEAELRADETTKLRVYVASVHPELTESDIQTVFEAFGKVNSCTLYPDPKIPGRHRGFGYIDFETEEAALSAISSMNCFDLAGQQLRVGRVITPRGVPLPFEMVSAKNANNTASNHVSASAVALAAASISAKVMSMSADELNSVNNVNGHSARTSVSTGFSGPSLVQNLPPPGVFIPTAIGEKSETSNSGEAQVDTAASVWDDDDDSAIPLPDTFESTNENETTVNPDSEYHTDNQPDHAEPRVLLLENMVSIEELDDDLKDEVNEECSKYGVVLQTLVHVTAEQSVRIFVQFESFDEAKVACDALNQRFFAGRIVHAKLYNVEQFESGQLDG